MSDDAQAAAEDAARHALEAEGAATAAEAKSFSPDYVKALRDEAAGWRVKAQQYSQPWEGVTDDDQKVWKEMIRRTQADPKDGAKYMAEIAGFLSGEATAPPEGPPPASTGLSERDVQRLVDERVNASNQQSLIRGIEQEAKSLGYEPGSLEYVNLLWTAEHETGTDLKAADTKIKERRQADIERAIAERQGNAGWPIPVRGGSAPSADAKPIKSFSEARASLEERLNRI